MMGRLARLSGPRRGESGRADRAVRLTGPRGAG